MPLSVESGYVVPQRFRNGQVQTIYPTLFRPMPRTSPQREQISTPDNDVLDIDWHLPLLVWRSGQEPFLSRSWLMGRELLRHRKMAVGAGWDDGHRVTARGLPVQFQRGRTFSLKIVHP